MNELALFTGAGGGVLGGILLGWRTRCAVEIDPYARRILLARQRDRCLPRFPIWDDITTFDGKPWRGNIDIITGGFPCVDISCAGRGAGINGPSSGLWKHMARIIGEVGPKYVLVENSPVLVSRGLGVVLGDLASLGYNARWGILGAHHAGAPHKRDRIWILADAKRNQQPWEEPRCWSSRRMGRVKQQVPWDRTPERALSELRGMDNGLAPGLVRRTDCIRNGQVPSVVALAWNTLLNQP